MADKKINEQDAVTAFIDLSTNFLLNSADDHSLLMRADLDRRLDDFEQTGDTGDSWETVKARILKRCQRSPS